MKDRARAYMEYHGGRWMAVIGQESSVVPTLTYVDLASGHLAICEATKTGYREITLSAEEALELLGWLKEREAELRRLAEAESQRPEG